MADVCQDPVLLPSSLLLVFLLAGSPPGVINDRAYLPPSKGVVAEKILALISCGCSTPLEDPPQRTYPHVISDPPLPNQ